MLERALGGQRDYQAHNYEARARLHASTWRTAQRRRLRRHHTPFNETRVIAVSVKDAILTAIGSEAC